MKLSLNDLKELINCQEDQHPFIGKRVIAILPYGFVFAGDLSKRGAYFKLSDAVNIRYWAKRDGGLPELASKGFVSEDCIDSCFSPVIFEAYIAMLEWKVHE